MRTIAHISDLHFGKTKKAIEEGLLRDLRALQPSVIAVSGDLTQGGHRRQFKRAREYLERLSGPLIVVPGNHDIPSFDLTRRFLLPLYRYKNYISKHLNPIYVDNEVTVIGINSARSLALMNGKIDRRQLRKVTKMISGMPKRGLRVIVTHHPFHRPPKHEHREIVAGAKKALPVFESWGIDLVLGGHYHVTHAHDLSLSYPQLKKPMLHILAGAALSTWMNGKQNSYNLITIHRGSIVVDIRSWNGKQYESSRTVRFKRSPRGWKEVR